MRWVDACRRELVTSEPTVSDVRPLHRALMGGDAATERGAAHPWGRRPRERAEARLVVADPRARDALRAAGEGLTARPLLRAP